MRQPLTLGTLARYGLLASIAAAVVASFAVALALDWEAGLLCLLGTAALAASSLPLVLHRVDEIAEPLWFVVLIVAVGVTGKAFYLHLGPRTRVDFLLLGKEPRDLLFAASIMTLGLLCLSLGYLVGRVSWRVPAPGRPASAVWNRERYRVVVGTLLLVGLLSFVVFAARQDLSLDSLAQLSAKRGTRLPSGELLMSDGYLRWGATLIEIAFYLALAGWVAGRPKFRSYTGVAILLLAVLALAFPIFVSSRQAVMFVIIRAILIWTCIRREPKPQVVLALAMTGLVVIGSMLAFRREQTGWADIRSHIGWSEMLEVTVGSRHFLDLSKTAHVLAAVPDTVGYQYGRTMLTWLVAPVPRALWPGKPDIGVGRQLGPPVFQRAIGTGGVPPGIIGELHLNFGLAGVLIGLFAVGLLLRSLWTTLRPHFPSAAVALIFTLLSTRLTLDLLANSFSGAISKLLQEMIPVMLALYALSYRPRRRPAAVAPAAKRVGLNDATAGGSRTPRQAPRSARPASSRTAREGHADRAR